MKNNVLIRHFLQDGSKSTDFDAEIDAVHEEQLMQPKLLEGH